MRDTTQKYTIAIIEGKDFDSVQLETMFNTAIERNQRHNGNLTSLYGLFVLMPLIKRHYTTECDPWTLAPMIYDRHKSLVAMGKVFGSVVKSNTGDSLNSLRTQSHVRNIPQYNDKVEWLDPAFGVRSKKTRDDHMRITAMNLEKFNTINIMMSKLGAMSLVINLLATHGSETKVKITYGNDNCIWLDAYSSTIVSKTDDTITVVLSDDDIWEMPIKDNKVALTIAFKHAIMDLSTTDAKKPANPYNTDVCCICLDDLVGRRTVLLCQHMFHSQCIQSWQSCNRACPLCKR